MAPIWSNQTTSSLTLNNVTAADAGTYTITVTGTCGNPVTRSATLTVNENVVVVSAPVSLTNCPGTTASFNVTATGTGLSYQWSKNGAALVDQTSSSLSLNNVTAADAGTYTITLTGTCGNPVTRSATLTVNENIVVASAPVSLTNCPGTTASFSVSATGTGLSYQWIKDGTALVGRTGSTLVLNSVTSANAGTYAVVVSGTCGNSVTNFATLAVNENVVVASAPVSLTNCPGTTASFSVSATGTGLNYQWLKDGLALPGATSSTLTLNNVASVHAGPYAVVVRGTCGNAVTNSATLTVNENVVVASAPVSLTNCPGTTANFSVSATGTGLSYQWSKNGTDLVNQTTSSLTLNNVTAADAGTYTITRDRDLRQPGDSLGHPDGERECRGGQCASQPDQLPRHDRQLQRNATGTGLSYQWSKNGAALVDQTSSSLSLNNVTAADAGTYTITLTGTCGNPVTRSATLTVNENVVVASAPVSLTNCPGTTASFSVSATGTGLSYQWIKDGTALVGRTGSTLVLNSVTSANAGTYAVVVSGTCGNSVTNFATLAVNQNVVVASAPVSLTNCPGTTASFSVSATGTGLNYQWLKDGLALPGATSSTLTLNNVASVHAGTVCGGGSRHLRQCSHQLCHPDGERECRGGQCASQPDQLPRHDRSFSVSATGTGLSYQWSKNGTDLVNQTTSSLTLNNVTAADAGTYTITLTGTCGNPVTRSATLTVNENVVVVSAPVSLTNCPGTTASFSVNATGTGLSYQWSKNGADPG